MSVPLLKNKEKKGIKKKKNIQYLTDVLCISVEKGKVKGVDASVGRGKAW